MVGHHVNGTQTTSFRRDLRLVVPILLTVASAGFCFQCPYYLGQRTLVALRAVGVEPNGLVKLCTVPWLTFVLGAIPLALLAVALLKGPGTNVGKRSLSFALVTGVMGVCFLAMCIFDASVSSPARATKW
jgi:hypothetical protein